MKITIFTSNDLRHINLINKLAKISTKCFAIVEGKTLFPGKVDDFFKKTKLMKKYFANVKHAEKKFFSSNRFINENVKCKFIKQGDLNFLVKQDISEALNSDIYIVFGSSYIKGWLINFLIKKKAINIHMGLSPYYRGSSCNFWALQDNNPHLVGATIHYLSKGLDNGKIICHVLPNKKFNSIFEYTMSVVKNAHSLLAKKIKDKTILKVHSHEQNYNLERRYSKNIDFNDKVLKTFFKNKITVKYIKKTIKNKFDKNKFINI